MVLNYSFYDFKRRFYSPSFSIYNESIKILLSSVSYLSSSVVLSYIFYLERFIKQMVGPNEEGYLCLCSLPRVGDRFIDLLTEYVTI
jgi:hypothetical protein